MKKYNPKGRLRSCKGLVHKYIPSDRPTKESKQCNNKRRIHVKYVIIIITIWTSSNQEANNSESLSIKRRKKTLNVIGTQLGQFSKDNCAHNPMSQISTDDGPFSLGSALVITNGRDGMGKRHE